MTKRGLVAAIAERSGLSKKDAEVALNATFSAIKYSLGRGEKVSIQGFGSFSTKLRKAKEGCHPKTREVLHIPAKIVPFFSAGSDLKKVVSEVSFEG